MEQALGWTVYAVGGENNALKMALSRSRCEADYTSEEPVEERLEAIRARRHLGRKIHIRRKAGFMKHFLRQTKSEKRPLSNTKIQAVELRTG